MISLRLYRSFADIINDLENSVISFNCSMFVMLNLFYSLGLRRRQSFCL